MYMDILIPGLIVALIAFIFYGIKVLISLKSLFDKSTQTLDLVDEAIEESTRLVETSNDIVDDVKKTSSEARELLQTTRGKVDTVLNVMNVLNTFKKKQK